MLRGSLLLTLLTPNESGEVEGKTERRAVVVGCGAKLALWRGGIEGENSDEGHVPCGNLLQAVPNI